MTKSKIHKIIVKRNNYDILSAGTDFYAYMDDSRLYYTFDQLIYKDDLSEFYERVEKLSGGFFIMRMVAVDGSLLPCYVSVEPGNAEDRVLISLINIDKLLESEEKLHNRLVIENKLVELYGDDIFVYEPESDEIKLITKFNIAQETKVMTLEDFGDLLQRHVPIEKMDEVAEFVRALRSGSRYFEISVHGSITDDDSEVKYTVIKGAYVYKDGEKLAATGYIHKGLEKSSGNARKVEMDSLTGLLGKGEITDMAIRAIDVEKKENICIAILDVDYFKKVNDTFGHMVGDATLRKVAAIIETEVGNNGVVGRIGGDEFFILFYNAYDMETSRERLRSIKNIVSANFPPDDENNPAITLSIGCAAYPKDAKNYSDLFALADFALYRAKEKGRNRYIIYDMEKHGTLEEI